MSAVALSWSPALGEEMQLPTSARLPLLAGVSQSPVQRALHLPAVLVLFALHYLPGDQRSAAKFILPSRS